MTTSWHAGLVVAGVALAVCAGRADAADPSPDPYSPARVALASASDELRAHFSDIQKRNGDAVDLQSRLDSDLGTVMAAITPPAWTQAEYADAYARIAALDASLVDQLSTGTYHDIAAVRGLDEVLVKSPVDGTMQPVSLFVPSSYDPGKPAPLVVFLHGRGWSEADMLGVPFVRDLAQSTGAIVAAPYARGDIQYADPAPADIYATVAAVEQALNVDRKRVFLAGHSMGGYGVFNVGPLHSDVWSALMCVSGALTNETRDVVVRRFRDKAVYVVSGVKDDVIPHRASQVTVRWLREASVPTRFYAEPEGGHSMATFRPALRAAWNDMLAGVRSDSGSVNLSPLDSPPSSQMR